MSTKKKSDAMKFLESLVGELTFGGLIEALRGAEEMSQVEFAKKLGIFKQHLCVIENIKQSKPRSQTRILWGSETTGRCWRFFFAAPLKRD